MLDHELKQAYQKITPSSELEQRIRSLQAPKRSTQANVLRFTKPLISVAACMVVLLSGVLTFARNPQAELYTVLLADGAAVSDTVCRIIPEASQEMMAAMPRMVDAEAPDPNPSHVSIDLHISSPEEVSVSVETGILYIVSKEDEEESVTEVGSHFARAEDGDTIHVRWVIPASDTNAVYSMILGQNEVVCVTYDVQTDEYLISRTVAEQ